MFTDSSMFQHEDSVNEKKYYTTKTLFSWGEARNRCQLLGGDLTTLGIRNETIRK